MTTIDPLAIFDAEIVRVKTMADGSPRFEFGAGEEANRLLSILADMQASHRLIKMIIFDIEDWERLAEES